MRGLLKGLVGCLGVSLCLTAYAGENPIGWTLSGGLPAQTQPNQTYAFSYRFTSKLPFTMPTPLYVTTLSSIDEFTTNNNCNGVRLAVGASCTVDVFYAPKTAGKQTFRIAMEYGKNQVPLPLLTTVAAGSNSLLAGVVSVPFPSSILSNTTYYVSFTFTNNGTTTANNLSVTANNSNSSGYTQVSDTCLSSLAPGATCSITGSFTTAATSGFVSEGYTYSSSIGSGKVTTSTVVNNATGAQVRTFSFLNSSNQAVSFGFNGGAISNSPVCTSDSNCPTGSHCRSSTQLCYYANPVPINGQYSLTASGGTNTVSITDYKDLPFVWSGGVAGRTGCPTSGACLTADCGSGGSNAGCPVGQGFNNPATLAEFTLLRSGVDTYDITAINGVNIGMSMGPTGNTPASSQPYFCGNPGGTTANNVQMGNCSWTLSSFVPTPASTSSTYTYVNDTTGQTCTTTSDCSSFAGTVCGLIYDATNNTLPKRCGQLLGFLNANQVCSFAHTNFDYPNSGNNPGDAYFNCDNQLTTPSTLTPYSELSMYGCKTPNAAQPTLNSCYNTYSGFSTPYTDCCGCVDWWTVGASVPSAATQSCGSNTNSFWTGTVEATVLWLKKACPTMYVYQYDDASSKFTCSNIVGSSQNTVNYTITYFTVS